MAQIKARIIGTGSYLPERILTNFDLEKMVDTTNEWISARTGIKERHIAANDEQTSDLAMKAAQQALDMAGVSPEQIDMVVLATITGDFPWPSTACLVQDKIGAKNASAWDVSAACSGFVYALASAAKFIESGTCKRALVIGAEVLSRIIDWEDRNTCILFGDGAGALLLGSSNEAGILSTHIHSDGEYEDLLYCPNPQTATELNKDETGYVKMRGNEVFKVAVNTLGRIVDETLKANNMQKSDVCWLVPHQANIRIIAATAKKLKMPMDHVVLTLENQGNTSSASVLLALNEAIRDGRIQRGQVVLLEAFGAGFTWGSALIKY